MFFRMVLVIIFCVGLIGCTEPNEFFDNDGTTYTVVTYGNKPVDDYLNQGSLVLQYLEIDKSGKVNKIFINTWGEFTVMGINEEVASFFELEEKYYPYQHVYVYNLKISRGTLEGKFLFTGPTIYTIPVDFTAVKGIKK